VETDWAEKYRPRSLRDVVGNEEAKRELLEWARSWEKGSPESKCVILEGRPGIGKTSAALALARDLGWSVIELNASDVRTEQRLKAIALRGAEHEGFTDEGTFVSSLRGKRKLIILDEADNLYETADRGGRRGIIAVLEKSKQPIVLIVNDLYALTKGVLGGILKKRCKIIHFRPINYKVIAYRILKRVCESEGLRCDPKALELIARKNGGDVRACLNDLQALSMLNREITPDLVDVLGYRDIRENIYAAVVKILKGKSLRGSLRVIGDTQEDPEMIMYWLAENVPVEYRDPEDMVRGMEFVSKASLYLGMAKRRQVWSLWKYAMDMMAAVSIAKRREYHGRVKYKFPEFLKQMSRLKALRDARKSLKLKLARLLHLSSVQVEEILVMVASLYVRDSGFRRTLDKFLHLSEHEKSILEALGGA